MIREIQRAAVCAAVLVAAAGQVQAGTITIDTTSAPAGAITSFGESNTATYGQTFTVTGPQTVLENFSFFMNDYNNPDAVDFGFFLAEWDGVKAVGPVLFESAMVSTTNNGGADGFEQFTFTPNIELDAGVEYVAFANASKYFDGMQGLSRWPYTNSDAYALGNYVYENNGGNFNSLFTGPWDFNSVNNSESRDTHFIATFSEPAMAAVPEPSSLAVFGVIGGVLGIGATCRRRISRRAELVSNS